MRRWRLNDKMLSRTHHCGETTSAKRKAVLDRIQSLEEAIRKAREYLESGKHGHVLRFGSDPKGGQ
jgi:hypothetical protein